MPPAAPPPAPTSPRCPLHQRTAVATCARCGSFLCGECAELLDEAAYCAACVTFLQTHGRPSRALWLALALEGVALGVLPLGWIPLGWLGERAEVFRAALLVGVVLVRMPVLTGLAAGVGFWVTTRERRREALTSTARRWVGVARVLAWLCLGYVVLEVAWLITLFLPRVWSG